LADFGIAVVGQGTAGQQTTTRDIRGTMSWLAPEYFEESGASRVTPAADVYAFALLCVQVSRSSYLAMFSILLSAGTYWWKRVAAFTQRVCHSWSSHERQKTTTT
jgi:serine/threonine protein kinase